MTTGEILTLLLGGGALATITALFQGIRSLQSGARAREKETVKDLVRQRDEYRTEKEFAEDERDYWRRRAATVEYEAMRAGVDLPEALPEPVRPVTPSEEAK